MAYRIVQEKHKAMLNQTKAVSTQHDAPPAVAGSHLILSKPTRAMKQALRRKERKQVLRKERAVAERPYRPGYDFRCLFCPGMFHRAGLIDHIKSSHPGRVGDEFVSQELRLRKPKKVSDVEFIGELQKHLRNYEGSASSS